MEPWISLLSPLVSVAAALVSYAVMSRRIRLLMEKETIEADIDDTKTRRKAEIDETLRKDQQMNALIAVVGEMVGRLAGVTDAMNGMILEQQEDHKLEADRIALRERQAMDQGKLLHDQLFVVSDNTLATREARKSMDELAIRVTSSQQALFDKLATQDDKMEEIRKSLSLIAEKFMRGLIVGPSTGQ